MASWSSRRLSYRPLDSMGFKTKSEIKENFYEKKREFYAAFDRYYCQSANLGIFTASPNPVIHELTHP
jgi:hypothetical protein